jgi:hypothetical protein
MKIECYFQIYLQRSVRIKEESTSTIPNGAEHILPDDLPLVLKSKLLIVDLAGSERIDKSGITPPIFSFVLLEFLLLDIGAKMLVLNILY